MAWIEKKKKKDGRTAYLVRWREPGVPKVRSESLPTFEAARHKKSQVEVSIATGLYVSADERLVPLGRYLTTIFESNSRLRASTRMVQGRIISKHITSSRLAGIPVGKVDAGVMREFFADLEANGASSNTALACYQILSTVLRTAHEEGLLPRYPLAHIPRPRPTKADARFLGPQEIEALASEVPERYRVLVLAAAYSGLRIGELAALQATDIDILRRTITVRRSATRTPAGYVLGDDTKTAAGRRKVEIPAFLAQELGAYIGRYPPASDGRIFTAPRGGFISSGILHEVWHSACARAGLEPAPRFHDLRHTAVALAIQQGAHPLEIKERMGHTSIQITMDRYGHLFPGMDRELASRLGDVRAEALKEGKVVQL